jgi:prepilin peptidase CpaA
VTTTIAVLVLATLTAAAIDVRTRRIPNWLTGALVLVALGIHIPEGLVPALTAVASICAAFALGSIAFSAGWFGGGDVKLIAACCGLVSFPGSVAFVLFVLFSGALLALVAAAFRGRLVALVRSTAAVAVHGAPTEKNALPYGVAIAAGSITYAVSTFVPALRLPI